VDLAKVVIASLVLAQTGSPEKRQCVSPALCGAQDPKSMTLPGRHYGGIPDVNQIVRRSAQATLADRRAAPGYDYFETDKTDDSWKTYSVRMLFGSPYRVLIAVNGIPVSSGVRRQEREKLRAEIERRRTESPEARAGRIEKYEKNQQRDMRFIQEFVDAFDFKMTGLSWLNGFDVYVIRATPKPGYEPFDAESAVLTGMRGTLWIDRVTDQWVKVQAEVIRPVTIEGFLAQVEPGTRFELEQEPFHDGLWFPSHFSMKSKVRILFMFRYGQDQDESYYDYHPATGPGG
jgi:hypothetical protein